VSITLEEEIESENIIVNYIKINKQKLTNLFIKKIKIDGSKHE